MYKEVGLVACILGALTIGSGNIGSKKVAGATQKSVIATLSCEAVEDSTKVRELLEQLRAEQLQELQEKNPYLSPEENGRILNAWEYTLGEREKACET